MLTVSVMDVRVRRSKTLILHKSEDTWGVAWYTKLQLLTCAPAIRRRPQAAMPLISIVVWSEKGFPATRTWSRVAPKSRHKVGVRARASVYRACRV